MIDDDRLEASAAAERITDSITASVLGLGHLVAWDALPGRRRWDKIKEQLAKDWCVDTLEGRFAVMDGTGFWFEHEHDAVAFSSWAQQPTDDGPTALTTVHVKNGCIANIMVGGRQYKVGINGGDFHVDTGCRVTVWTLVPAPSLVMATFFDDGTVKVVDQNGFVVLISTRLS